MSHEATYTTDQRAVKRQIYVCRLNIGGKRERICGDFATVMLLLRLALGVARDGDRRASASAAIFAQIASESERHTGCVAERHLQAGRA